jgi:hypothetical protein
MQLVQTLGTLGGDNVITYNIVKMYVFGDQYMIPQLRRETLGQLFRHMDYRHTILLSSDMVTYAFDRLHPNDPLCRYLVDVNLRYDWCTSQSGTPYELNSDHNWPTAYLLSFAHRATKVIRDINFGGKYMSDFNLDLCDYHEHQTSRDRMECDDKQVEAP